VLCRQLGVTEVSLQGNVVRFGPIDLPDSAQLRLQRLYDKAHYKQAVSTMSVPRPKTAQFGGEPLRDVALLNWCGEVLTAVRADPAL
jgi:transcription-repair coupling factor (superfamily II helicase)